MYNCTHIECTFLITPATTRTSRYTTMLYPDSIMAVGIAAMRPSESENKTIVSYAKLTFAFDYAGSGDERQIKQPAPPPHDTRTTR